MREEFYHSLLDALQKIAKEKGTRPIKGGTSGEPFTSRYFQGVIEQPLSTVSFVDGGNQEILGGPHFSLQLIRVASVTYKNKKSARVTRKEGYVLLYITEEGCTVQTFGKIDMPFTTIQLQKEVNDGLRQRAIQNAGNIVRRCTELQLANTLTTTSDCVVIDGSVQAQYEEEKIFLQTLKGKPVCGLLKTNSLLTDEQHPVLHTLQNYAPAECNDMSWFYWPLFKTESLTAVRLHKSANRCFLVDFISSEKKKAIIATLVQYAVDPVFLGYPYGLVKADELARVSNNEKNLTKLQLQVQLSKLHKAVEASTKSSTAHDVLDNI